MTRRYRKFEVSTWTDENFAALSAPQPNAQTLWIYLLTGQRTTIYPGLVVARDVVIASDLGWSVEDTRRVFAELEDADMAIADWKAGVIRLPKALIDSKGRPRETNRPESPNVIKSWGRYWGEVPECGAKRAYLDQLITFAALLGDPFQVALHAGFDIDSGTLRKASGKPSRKPFGKDTPHPSPNQDTGDRISDRERPVIEVDPIAAPRSGASGSGVTADRATGARDAPIAKVLPFVVPGDERTEERRRLLRVIGQLHVEAFNRLRVELVSTVPPMGAMGDPAERALRALIEHVPDLTGLEAKLRHVLAYREREARAIGKLKWFGAMVWSEGPFDWAATREIHEADATAAIAGAAEPSPNHGPPRCVPFGEALDEANAIAAANGILPRDHA